ncbi:hypothetical protein GQ53DRAFT_753806 [Thozetella sp. PMI_491]|nr:hypothetical protein GQ53DRAFT_753806 [Thozetella sp. PMI_491]
MGPQVIHLPDGQNFTVTPVFAGLFFKSHELNTHPHAFPAGWTVVLHTEVDSGGDHEDAPRASEPASDGSAGEAAAPKERKKQIQSYTKPTLQNDSFFISSISNPSSNDFKPAASPTRQIAMMLYVTLYWYFHQEQPAVTLTTPASKLTPEAARPKGEWRINVKKDGVLRGRNLIPKLERMGLIASLDSAVGTDIEDDGESWAHMFVSRRMFWQTPGRLFLFTLQHANTRGSSYPGSPVTSRPGSPVRNDSPLRGHTTHLSQSDLPGAAPPVTLTSVPSFPIGPFFSASHLPTYYPPAAAQYIVGESGVRHPIRPKPPRMGEVFYTRFVPSVGQYLSFRVASSSSKPVPYLGPVGPNPPDPVSLGTLSDAELLQKWMANPRVQRFWGAYEPNFLSNALSSRHSFPAIGLWDGVPFGYFEIYWVKEDVLGRYVGGNEIGDWDRGYHIFVGEEWARGRAPTWLSSLVHWSFCADYRTTSICIEPRVDNERFIQLLQAAGFSKEREIAFPHKQSWFGRLRRDAWEAPAL